MSQMKRPLLTILLVLLFLTTSCTDNNSITGSNSKSLTKPTESLNISSDDDDCISTDIGDWIMQWYGQYGAEGLMVILINRLLTIYKDTGVLDGLEENGEYFRGPWNRSEKYTNYITQPLYDFRDNYLANSSKGKTYIKSYYELGKFGIKNNLINKYYLEYLELLLTSAFISQELQHGTNNDLILIDSKFADKLREMLTIYKEHPDHREIDPVLDYLEIELNKYQNKPKSEISASFN